MPKRRNRDRAERRRAARTTANALTRGLAASQATEPVASRAYVRHQSILDRLANRNRITEKQRDAGARLAIDYRIASGGRPRLVLAYDQLGNGKAPKGQGFVDNDGPTQLDARRRFEAAVADLGRELAPVIIHTVITDRPVGEWVRIYRRPTTFGMELLRRGLDVLIRHYARPAAERLRLAAAAAPRHIDVPLVAPLPARANGAAPRAPTMSAATGYGAFLAAQAIGPGIDDNTLDEALGYAVARGWTNGHASPEDQGMVTATRQLLAIARARDEKRPAVEDRAL